MELFFDDGSVFRDTINVIKTVCTDANIEFLPSGFLINGLDGSHICMTRLWVDVCDITQYSCAEKIVAGVSLNSLFMILKLIQNNSSLKLVLPNAATQLHIECNNKNTGIDYKYSLNLMDLDNDELDIPEMDFMSSFKVNSKIYRTLIENTSLCGGPHTQIKCEKHKLIISNKGDTSTLDSEIHVPELETETTPMKYSCNLMNVIAKADKIAENVEISIGQDIPIRINYSFGKSSYFQFYLAPVIDDM